MGDVKRNGFLFCPFLVPILDGLLWEMSVETVAI